jgi:AAA+ superfamily predicted ATPase
VLNVQRAKVFFNDPELLATIGLPADPNLPMKPTDQEIIDYLDSSACPLNRIVVSERNKPAMKSLRTYAFNALLNPYHSCSGMNFGFYAGPGQGKSFMVRCWAETVGIPFIDIASETLESTWQLYELIAEKFSKGDTPLVPTLNEETYAIPPCIIFFDEAQSLKKDLRTAGGLLKAMERADGWLQTVTPKSKVTYRIACHHVCWVAASTDPGEIYAQSEAFHSRFSQDVIWYPAGRDEVALIVQRTFPELPMEACKSVAYYSLVPRKAISFADLMMKTRRMAGCSWAQAAKEVAVEKGIDEFGMEEKGVMILRALGQRPVARTGLPTLARCRPAELEKIILPPLFDNVEGRGQLIRPTPRGFAITRAGLLELEKRKIPHKGEKITAESIESSN